MATSVPITSPSRIDSRCSTGGAKRSTARMTTRVKNASPTFPGDPYEGLADPPPTQPAATAVSDTPMIRMIVPVTSGGKNRSSWEKTDATRIMKSPEMITDA